MRLAAHRQQSRFETERAKDFHRIGSKLDAGADLAELARPLVDAHLDAVPAQRAGSGQAAQSGSDDCHVEVIHVGSQPIDVRKL